MRRRHLLADAVAFPIERALVEGCLNTPDRPTDELFERVLAASLSAIGGVERARLAGITGHVGESVAELLLVDRGWTPVWHFVGSGGHGVDLLLLAPGEMRVVAIEVKATFRPGHWPQLTRGTPAQMDVSWLDKEDNPGLIDWQLTSGDVYGGIVAVNFRDLVFKAALSCDFLRWHPVATLDQLDDLAWLDAK